MKKIKEYHSPLFEYLQHTGSVGHTTLIMDGAMNAQYPFIVLGKDIQHAKELIRQSKNRFAIPQSMNAPDAFRGYRHPVLMDNYVIIKTCEGYIATIRDYREENTRLNNELKTKNDIIDTVTTMPFWMRLFGPLYRRRIKRLNK